MVGLAMQEICHRYSLSDVIVVDKKLSNVINILNVAIPVVELCLASDAPSLSWLDPASTNIFQCKHMLMLQEDS